VANRRTQKEKHMTNTTAAPANLRNAKKAQAATKRAPAKAANKAAPKPAAKATPAKAPAATGAKLRWTTVAEYANGKHQTAEADGRAYAIVQAGDGGYKATCKSKGKTAVLATGSFGVAYNAVVRHNREAAPAAENAA
jgi:hypothetical protein